jgi:hypothetical protein
MGEIRFSTAPASLGLSTCCFSLAPSSSRGNRRRLLLEKEGKWERRNCRERRRRKRNLEVVSRRRESSEEWGRAQEQLVERAAGRSRQRTARTVREEISQKLTFSARSDDVDAPQ